MIGKQQMRVPFTDARGRVGLLEAGVGWGGVVDVPQHNKKRRERGNPIFGKNG
jgi:hypothetical protein